MLAWRFRDIEDKQLPGLCVDDAVISRNLVAYLLTRAQCAEQIILHLVESQNADDFKVVAMLLNTKNQMPTSRIRERGDGFKSVARNFVLGGLHFEVRPLISLDTL